jgi:hypothetical protein
MRFKNLLATFMTIGIFCLFAIGASAAPKGETPTKYYWDDFGDPAVREEPFLSCDGFDVILHVEYSGWWIVHPETSGKGQWESYFSFSGMKVYNASNPDLYMDGVPGGKWNRRWKGPAQGSNFIETGVQLMLTIPHYGVIYRDVGRVEIDINNPSKPVIYVGHWDLFDGFDEDIVALCSVLAE